MPELGGDVEGVEVDAGADGGGLEVIEAEEVAEELLGVVLRRDVERCLSRLRLGRRQGGRGSGVELLDEAPDGVDITRSDSGEEGLVRSEP